MWLVAGAGAFALGRLVRAGRGRWPIEATLSIVAASLAGLSATAMDFGGLQEPDWRAGLFAFLVASGVVALGRLWRVIRESRSRRA